MRQNEESQEKLVLIQVMRLNATILGLVLGLLFGLTIFVATNILVVKGGDVIGPHLSLLGEFFWGYRVTFLGSLVGFLYGFSYGFIVGYVFARLYNWLAYFRENEHSADSQHKSNK